MTRDNYSSAARYEELVASIARQMTNHTSLVELGLERHGLGNKWQGASGYRHQIDVSLEGDKHILLVECKLHGKPLSVETFLTLLARRLDISTGPEVYGREVRAALVSNGGFQRGVITLARYYVRDISLYQAIWNKDYSLGTLAVVSHTHFIAAEGLHVPVSLHPGAISQSQSPDCAQLT